MAYTGIDGAEPDETIHSINVLARRYESPSFRVDVAGHYFQAGAARSRSLALYRNPIVLSSEMGWVLTLDADDVLLPHTISQLVTIVSEHPSAHWVAGGVLLQQERNNTRVMVDAYPWEGSIPQGFSQGNWFLLPPLIPAGVTEPRRVMDSMEESGLFPIFAATMLYKVGTIWGLGGWPGTPTGEDAALLVRVSDLYPGVVLSEPLIVYRQHEGQNTRNEWHARNKEVTWRMIQAERTKNQIQ